MALYWVAAIFICKMRMKRMSEKAAAFALIGDRYHNSDYIRTALGKTLVRDLGLTIDFTDEVTLLSAKTLEGYRLLILFRDGMIWPEGYGQQELSIDIVSDPPVPERETARVAWMTEAQGQAVKTFVEDGGLALLYHNVTYIATDNENFRSVLGRRPRATRGAPL